MKTKLAILAIAMATIMALGMVAYIPKAAATPIYGPRVNEVLCEIYTSGEAEYAGLLANNTDLMDWQLTPDLIPGVPATVTLDFARTFSMWEFDLNNNATIPSFPNVVNPCSDVYFRQAIAYMSNKPYIVSNIVGGLGVTLDNALFPWTPYWGPSATYPYSPAQACQLLFTHGWRDSADPNFVTDVHFPDLAHGGWPRAYPGAPDYTGMKLKDVLIGGPSGHAGTGLVVIIRQDDPLREQAGLDLCNGALGYGQGLVSIGIPCNEIDIPRTAGTSTIVMYHKDFMIYTGGWSLSRTPDYIYDLWNSVNMNWAQNAFAWNYDNINNAAWDLQTALVKHAPDQAHAITAGQAASVIFGTNVFFIPIWASAGDYAHNKPWHVLNTDGFGVQSSWNIYAMNNPMIGVTGGTLRWGFASDIEEFNVINSQWVWDWQVLGEIFDSLISTNALNVAVDMPWMAYGNWTTGTWIPQSLGTACSKITFYLRPGIQWINPITGTSFGTVTPADVEFSAQYVYDQVGWNYGLVADIFHNATYPEGKITTTYNSITFYEDTLSTWAVDWLGGLPIIPKAIFEGIPDATGYTPGSSGLNATTLTGSGPFYFSSYHAAVSCDLKANRLYFAPIVPNTDTNPRITIDWGIFLSNPKAGDWSVNVLDLIVVAGMIGWKNATPPVPGKNEIPQDVNQDGQVNVLDLIKVAADIGVNWFV